jgi:hypothetical protein
MEKWHLDLCDNEATALQYEILAKQLQWIKESLMLIKNTRDFVNFISYYFTGKTIFVSEH